jgi:PEP-CTERM motif
MKPVLKALALSLAMVAGGAQAVGGSFDTVVPPGAIDYTFDNLSGNSQMLITGGQIKTGDVANTNIQPLGGDGSYWSMDPSNAPATSEGSISFTSLMSKVSFLWGSPDSFNNLVVRLAGGGEYTVVPFATGGVNANSRYLTIEAGAGEAISGLSFSSGSNSGNYAFEVDNLRYTVSPIPEPETYALMLAGLGLVGFIARRRRPQQ